MFNPTTSIKPVLYYYLDLSTSDDQSLRNCHREESGPTQRWCYVFGTWLWEGQATRETNVSTLTHCRQMNLFSSLWMHLKLDCQSFFIPGLYPVLNVFSNTLYPRMDRKDSLDKERYAEYDGRHQRLKVRRDSELTAPARVRPTSTSSYPSSTTTSSRDSAMSSIRDSATSFSRRRTQEITQV